MLGVITATGLALVCASVCGAAVWAACGLQTSATAAPAAGLALLLALSATAIRLPGRAVTAAIVVALAVVLSLVYLVSTGRTAILPRWAAVTALVVVLLALIPFAVSDRAGVLGVGTNDDMTEHLIGAWSLQGFGPASVSKLVAAGYPIGPHAIAATIAHSTGISLEHAFIGLLIAVPALLALAGAALLGSGPPAVLGAVGGLVGLCYLQSAFLVQASFKEPLEALCLLAFAAALRAQMDAGRAVALRAVPMGVIAAGAVYAYSYLGLAWIGGMLLVWALLSVVAGQRLSRPTARLRPTACLRPTERLRPTGRSVALGTAAFVLLIAPEISRMVSFAHSGYNQENATVFGNLIHALPPQEALGIWPRLDFRFDVPLASAGGIFGMLALCALLLCLLRSLARREFILPAAFFVATALYGVNAARSPYSAAKALAVLAPVAMLIIGGGFVQLWRGWSGLQSWRAGALALLAVLAGWAAYSDLELLRDAPVGPPAHGRELAQLRRLIGGSPTLFLGADDFVHWELRGTQIATPPQPLYATTVVPLRRTKAQQDPGLRQLRGATTTRNRYAGLWLGFDFDSVPTNVLDRFTFAILPRSSYQSAPLANWRLVASTGSYGLWRRTGPTQPYETLTEIDAPGAVLDCRTPDGRALANRAGVAMIRPAPVVGEHTAWRGDVGYAGRSVHQDLMLGAGVWAISLQYDATTGAIVRGPGLQRTLPANLEPLGPYWSVGTIRVVRPGRVRIVVSFRPLPRLGRVLGSLGLTRAPTPTGLKALGRVTASRSPVRDTAVALRQACGRYVDRYRTL